MHFHDIVGYAAGFLATAAFVPQVVKTFRERRAHDISLGAASHIIEHTSREHVRQPALRLDGPRVEGQGALVMANRLRVPLA